MKAASRSDHPYNASPPHSPAQIGCSDGKAYSIDALTALDEAGYTNIVGIRGGYYAWTKVFDNSLRRRRGDNYTEVRTDEDCRWRTDTLIGNQPKDSWVESTGD